MKLGRFWGVWLGLVAVLPMCDAGDSDSGAGAEAGDGGADPVGIPSIGGSESSPGGAGGVGQVPLPHAGGAGGQPASAGGVGVPQGGHVSGGAGGAGGASCMPVSDPQSCCENLPFCGENWDQECAYPDGTASCCDRQTGERVFCTSDATFVVPCVDDCTGQGLGTGACDECFGDAAECPEFEGLGGYSGLDSFGCGDATTCKNSSAGYRLTCTENSVNVACTCDPDATQ